MTTHAGRCVKITCNFTHPSKQTVDPRNGRPRSYKARSYIYSYERDSFSIRQKIEKHAKRQYADDNHFRREWIGFITTSDQILNRGTANSSL